MNKKTICLNMIVKNESHVIRRCLASVKGLIDYWVIVDTGSKDGTQEIIKEFLKDIPGELHERPWVDFGHNRNEALSLARKKADYLLFIDADDRLILSDGFVMPDLEKDCYCVTQHQEIKELGMNANTTVVLMIKDLPDFQWEGVVHEALVSKDGRGYTFLSGITNEYMHDGSRAKDPQRLEKDIQMLKKAIEKEPSNSRNVFYLAQTYRSAKNYRQALTYYEKRVTMIGRDDEKYYALHSIGLMQKAIELSPDIFLKSFWKAYHFRPTRAEPLFEVAGHYMKMGNYFLGYLVAKYALSIPLPQDLFVEKWIYDWGVGMQFYDCAVKFAKLDKANEIKEKLLANPHLPVSQKNVLQEQYA
jgi:glycosyltransferase involved in cell wall biosynthesis